MTFLLFAAAESGAHSPDEKGSSVFFAFDPTYFASQLFWLAILFGLLYFVLSRFILPKLGGTIEKRGDTIANDLDEATRLSEQAAESEKELDLSIAAARANARSLADTATKKIQAEIAAQTAKTDAELAAKLAAAENRISDLRKRAMTNVSGIASDAAGEMLAKFGLKPNVNTLQSAVADVLKS